jgi:hypothetical protein
MPGWLAGWLPVPAPVVPVPGFIILESVVPGPTAGGEPGAFWAEANEVAPKSAVRAIAESISFERM